MLTMREQNVGLALAISSSIFIGSSFIIKKKGLRAAGASGLRAGMLPVCTSRCHLLCTTPLAVWSSVDKVFAGNPSFLLLDCKTGYGVVFRCRRVRVSERADMVGRAPFHGGWRAGQLCSICLCPSCPCDSTGCPEHHRQVGAQCTCRYVRDAAHKLAAGVQQQHVWNVLCSTCLQRCLSLLTRGRKVVMYMVYAALKCASQLAVYERPTLFVCCCSAVLAHIFLKEQLNLFGILGCVLCITGSLTIVLHVPAEQPIESIAQVWSLAMQPGTCVIYACLPAPQ